MPCVRDVMTQPVITITPNKTVQEAARLMTEKDVECLVVAWGDRAVGIITEKDLVRRVIAENLPYATEVLEIMSRPLITIDEDASIREAMGKMKEHDISRLPVEKEGVLVGIVVDSDL